MIASYDALARNENAVEMLGDGQLRVTAQEHLSSQKSEASVDGQHRQSARALVKGILRKCYLPDLQDAAVQTLLKQAEFLAARWAAWPFCP